MFWTGIDVTTVLSRQYAIIDSPCSHRWSQEHFNFASTSRIQANDGLHVFKVVDFRFSSLAWARVQRQNQCAIVWNRSAIAKLYSECLILVQLPRSMQYLGCIMEPPWQWKRAGTDRHALAMETIEPASKTPKPKRWLNSKPTPFIVHWNRRLASNRELRFDVNTVKCWMSLHVKVGLESLWNFFFFLNSYDLKGKFLFHFYYIYLASKARANTPAASGAAAEVPECVLVHFPYKSVVACKLFKKKGETDCLSILHSASFFFAHELVIPFCPYHDNEMSRDKRPLVTWPRVSVVLFYFLATGSRGGLFFFCTTESSMHFPFRLNFWYKAHCFLQAEKAH